MNYQRNRIKSDAADRGWNLQTLFKLAAVNRAAGYSFMDGKSNSAAIAAKLTHALGRKPGFYRERTPRQREVA